MNKGCLIGAGALLIVMSFGLGYYFYDQSRSDPQKYESIKPEIKDILNKAVATGSIRPRLEVQIKPQVSGVIEHLYIEAGEIVKKGQKLAKIQLIPSEVNVNSARSNVELARIRVQEAERELTRQKSVFSNRLDVDEARRNLDQARKEEQRQIDLFEEGIVSKQDYERSKLDLDLKQNAYDNAVLRSQNTLSQFESQLEIRKRERDAAVNNLQLLREGITQNSRQVSNIVLSTVDGMVLDVPVEEGSSVIERNNFNEGTSIAVVADMSSLIFEGRVDESDVGKLKNGMPLILTVGAIPDKRFDAVLEFISPKGEETDGIVKFKIKAAIMEYSDDVFLRAGYSANADIIIDRRDKAVAIQERDVIYENDKKYVELVIGSDEYEKKEVELGLSDGLLVEVLSGIDTTTLIKVQLASNSDKS